MQSEEQNFSRNWNQDPQNDKSSIHKDTIKNWKKFIEGNGMNEICQRNGTEKTSQNWMPCLLRLKACNP